MQPPGICSLTAQAWRVGFPFPQRFTPLASVENVNRATSKLPLGLYHKPLKQALEIAPVAQRVEVRV